MKGTLPSARLLLLLFVSPNMLKNIISNIHSFCFCRYSFLLLAIHNLPLRCTRARLHVLRVLELIPVRLEELRPADAEEFFKEEGVAGVRFVYGDEDVSDERDEAEAGGYRVVDEHSAHKPVWYSEWMMVM